MTFSVFSPTADGVSVVAFAHVHVCSKIFIPKPCVHFATKIVAALLSPLFMSIGFFLWDCRWTSSGASAFALNS